MPFIRGTFLGSSVRSFSTSLAWNMGQPSSLTVQLVDDPINGDSFNPPAVGTPVYFSFYSLSFSGLLQKWERRNAVDGLPTYEVLVVDPREVLDGCQVILSAYNGSVGGLYNLVNAYGYWENQGFGLSYSNEAGMPWYRVKNALLAICNQPNYTVYGGPLTARGVKYSLDLSELPSPPDYYRVGPAISISLLELIAGLCDDGGMDFFVELNANTIKIRTVSRTNQPPLGTISSITNTNWGGTVVRSSNGLEHRNETTSAFLVGGEVTNLWLTDALTSFWGYDISGSPILGTNNRLDLKDGRYTTITDGGFTAGAVAAKFKNWAMPPGSNWPDLSVWLLVDDEIIQLTAKNLDGSYSINRGEFSTTPAAHADNVLCTLVYWSVYCDQMNLNASPVSDVLGTVSYPCSTLEMRLAKVNYESWAAYMLAYRKPYADIIGLTSPVRGGLGGKNQPFHHNVGNDKRDNAVNMNLNAVLGDLHTKEMRVYEFIRGYADEYMAKKFAVGLPFILNKQDPETLKVTYSYEVGDGGYLPEGSSPLGLSLLNEDAFKNQDGRFRAFGRFDSLTGIDLLQVSPQGSVAESGVLFLEGHADPNLIFTPTPAAVLTLQGGVFEEAVDALGGIEITSAVLQMLPEKAQKLLKKAQFGNVGVKVYPDYIIPSAVAVPLKSNTLCYGPWYVAGVAGKVRFESDQSLVPWNYGGFDNLNLAATARVTQAVSNMLEAEAGVLELAAPPTVSLGDVLQSGGPNVTNIQVSFGTNGVTTSYSFQTYSPRFGVFTKGWNDRLKRLSLTSVELRRALRASVKEDVSTAQAIGNANRAAKAFLQNAPKPVKKESPHDVLLSYCFEDADVEAAEPGVRSSGTPYVRVGVSTATFEEAVALSNADDDDEFRKTAIMGWSGLLRPFSTGPSGVSMARYTQPTGSFASALSKANLDPWKASNDVEVYTYGSTYESLNPMRATGDPLNARALALRGPLVVTGWGYDLDGNAVPSSGNPLLRSDLWKAGPVDLLWDDRRGVWTSHDVLKGVLSSDVILGSSGTLSVCRDGSRTSWELGVYPWGSSIASGTQAFALFNALDNRWYVTATPVFSASGAAYVFESPEFVVVATGGPSLVKAVWGTDIQSVGWANNAGTGQLFARHDHVHAHPVFASGDLHPEYNLPSGSPYTVLWQGTGVPTWTSSPLTSSVRVGSSGVSTSPGFLALGHPSNAKWLFLESPQQSGDITVRFPGNQPATGNVLAIASWDSLGRVAQTAWGDALPPGNAHEVLYHDGVTPQFTGVPTLRGVLLGGQDIGSGYVALGTPDNPSYLRLLSRGVTAETYWHLPGTLPSGGNVLGVETVDSGHVFLKWMGSLPVATGDGPEKLYFHTPEFVVSNYLDGRRVGAVWGAATQPIGFVGATGSSQLFAQADHVHAHGVFASGNLHPEYNIVAKTVDNSASGSPIKTFEFDQGFAAQLTISGTNASLRIKEMVGSGPLAARGLVPTPPGSSGTILFLREDGAWASPSSSLYAYGNPVAIGFANVQGVSTFIPRADHVHAHGTFASGDLHPEYNLTVRQANGFVSDVAKTIEFDDADAFQVTFTGTKAKINLDEMVESGPFAKRGLVPTPPGVVGNTKFLCEDGTWLSPSNVNILSSGVLPSGRAHEVLYHDGVSASFVGQPTISGVLLGGQGVSDQEGYLGLGTPGTPYYLNLLSRGATGDTYWHLPGTVPATSGKVLGVDYIDSAHLYLKWLDTVTAATGDGPEKWYFHSPEFVVTGYLDGRQVSANWGTGVQSVGWNNSPGTDDYFARIDHVHAHGIFSSGNLHPEYNITVREKSGFISSTAKTIEFDDGDGFQVSFVGTMATINMDEFVQSGPFAKRGLVPTPPVVAGNRKFLCEDGTWLSPSGIPNGLPTGAAYSVLWNGPTGVDWQTFPQLANGIIAGGSGVGDGVVSLGRLASSGLFSLSSVPRSTNATILFPGANPGTGQVLSVRTWDGASAELEWSSPDGVPSGQDYSVFWNGPAGGEPSWNQYPWVASGVRAGGSGIGDGIFAMGRVASSGFFNLQAAPRLADMTLLFPGSNPATGDFLQVVTIDSSNRAQLQWVHGLTSGVPYAANTYCSGNSLVVASGILNITNGLITSVS